MKKAERLQDTIEEIERRSSVIADRMAAQLSLPTGERQGLAELAAELSAQRAAAESLFVQLRRMVGRIARDDAEAGTSAAEFVRGLRGRLQLWALVDVAVAECLAGHEWPLVPEPPPRHDLAAVQASVVSKVFTSAHRAVNPVAQAAHATAFGCYPDIPLDAGFFTLNAHLACRLLMARRIPRPYAFLDVGCGGGMKVALAATMFDRADGLDYDAGYVEVANRNLQAMSAFRCRAFEADGLSFAGYDEYDVVYFFQPMQDIEGLLALERQIAANLRDGAVLIAPYAGFVWRAEALGCRQVAAGVYVKGMDEAAVAALAAEARFIGPDLYVYGTGMLRGARWLQPLWLACLNNGIRPGT